MTVAYGNFDSSFIPCVIIVLCIVFIAFVIARARADARRKKKNDEIDSNRAARWNKH